MAVFPESDRVIYERNTLAEVVCQLVFPTVLRIDATVPADFQDAVRASYPLFSKEQPSLPPGIPQELRQMFEADAAISGAYEFFSEDKVWKLSLTKDFVALTTSAYSQWEDFRRQLEGPLNALEAIYKPAFFLRVGLRYRNVIDRDLLGPDSPWVQILKGQILGEMGDDVIGPRIATASRTVVVDIDNSARVRIHHGLGLDEQKQKPVYIIDADFHSTDRTEVCDAIATLNQFNSESGRLFRWCITDGYHKALGPKPA